MIQRLLFAKRPVWILPLYRMIYPLLLVFSLWGEREAVFARSTSILCDPIPAFSLLSIPVLGGHGTALAFYLLLASLIGLSVGFFPRIFAGASGALFIWVIGSTISCASGKNPDYVPWHQAIVPFNLLILMIAPSSRDGNSLNWPIFLLKFNLVYAYFAGGVAKLQHGLDWMNGYSLQTHLIYSHLHVDTPAVLPLLKYQGLLVAISVIVVIAEITFPLALLSRNLALFYVGGSLIFQGAFFYLIKLRWMNYFGWSYLIYFLEVLAVLYWVYRGRPTELK